MRPRGGGARRAPAWMPRGRLRQRHRLRRDVLVTIFLRGGADGLSMCVPFAEPVYYARPGIHPCLRPVRARMARSTSTGSSALRPRCRRCWRHGTPGVWRSCTPAGSTTRRARTLMPSDTWNWAGPMGHRFSTAGWHGTWPPSARREGWSAAWRTGTRSPHPSGGPIAPRPFPTRPTTGLPAIPRRAMHGWSSSCTNMSVRAGSCDLPRSTRDRPCACSTRWTSRAISRSATPHIRPRPSARRCARQPR